MVTEREQVQNGPDRINQARRAVRTEIDASPDKFDGCVRCLPHQLALAARYPQSTAIRKIIAQNVKRFAAQR